MKATPSSDSPSVESNGAQLVSARVEINHIMVRGQDGKISRMCSCVIISVESVNEMFINRTDKRITASITSYETVCAIACGVPISVYFEFEAQPDQRLE